MVSIENTEDILTKEKSEALSEDEADDSDDMFEEAKGGSDSGSDYQESVCESPIQEECPEQIGRGRPKLVRSGKPGRPRKMYNTINVLQNVCETKIPQSVAEAKSSKYSSEWTKAMNVEYDALVRNKTWQLVDLPYKEKAIGCKWVFTIKQDKNGEIERFKARLVAKGCSQKFGVNYTETFSPVVRYATIRMVLALAAELKMYTHQMDVCSAYLNSELTDVVYMQQP
ncbi:unnamed protein product, partial [Ceratitis capitata]